MAAATEPVNATAPSAVPSMWASAPPDSEAHVQIPQIPGVARCAAQFGHRSQSNQLVHRPHSYLLYYEFRLEWGHAESCSCCLARPDDESRSGPTGAILLCSARSGAAKPDCFGGRCRQDQSANHWHPRVRFHYTPTHASWVNMVECFFSIPGKQGLSQSVHTSKRQLKEFLLDYIAHNNENPRPFVWTKEP